MNDVELLKKIADKLDGLMVLELNLKDSDGIQILKALPNSDISSLLVVLPVSYAEEKYSTVSQYSDVASHGPNDPELLLSPKPQNKPKTVAAWKQAFITPPHTVTDNDLSVEQVALTTREKEILTLIAAGMSNKRIARELEISECTVKVHVKNLLRKLNVRSRLEAAVWALETRHSSNMIGSQQ